MTDNLQCICLRVVRYSDSKSIATVWSRQRGRMAISIPAGNTPAAKRLRAIVQPMGTFECLARWRPGQNIAAVSDVRTIGTPVAITANPTRSIVALFIADFLCAVLRESAPDPVLSDYIFAEAAALATLPQRAIPNFHLAFIYHLTQFLGIAPDVSGYTAGLIFDMREARYVPSRPSHNQWLEGDEARLPMLLARISHRSLHLLRLNRDQRNTILDNLLQYYSMHYATLPTLSSLDVLRDIFR